MAQVDLASVKVAICEVGRRMYARGFVAGNDGNVSVRVGPDRVVATPTLVSKGFMTPEMLVLVDLDGQVIEGGLRPSSELKLHLRVYHERADVYSVVHAHPVAQGVIERFEFYKAAKKCFAVVQTSENRPYGCFILKKGVVFD